MILVFLINFAGVTPVAWGAERWSPEITYSQIVSKAQAGSPYFQGLLGIFFPYILDNKKSPKSFFSKI